MSMNTPETTLHALIYLWLILNILKQTLRKQLNQSKDVMDPFYSFKNIYFKYMYVCLNVCVYV